MPVLCVPMLPEMVASQQGLVKIPDDFIQSFYELYES